MDDTPIKIVVKDGGFKLAECSGGYGSGATATFIRQEAPLLAQQIEQVRALCLRTKQVSGVEPRLAEIGEQFPEIRKLCTPYDVHTYMSAGAPRDSRILTPRQAANEILEGLFPTLPPEYIERMGRKSNKPKKDSKE